MSGAAIHQKLSDALARYDDAAKRWGIYGPGALKPFLAAVREWDVARRAVGGAVSAPSEASQRTNELGLVAGSHPAKSPVPAAAPPSEPAPPLIQCLHWPCGCPNEHPNAPAEPAPPTAAPALKPWLAELAREMAQPDTPRVSPEPVPQVYWWPKEREPDNEIESAIDRLWGSSDCDALRLAKSEIINARAQLAEAQRELQAERRAHAFAVEAQIAQVERAEAAEREAQALREQCAKWADRIIGDAAAVIAEMRAASEARK